METFNYYYLLIFVIGIIFSKIFLRSRNINIPMSEYIKNFEPYNIVIMYYMEKAYAIVYKDHIMIFSLEAAKINDEQFQTAAEEFAKLTLKMMGPNIVREYLVFYGDEATLYFNMIEYFNDKYEADEIRKQSVDTIARHNEPPLEENEEN
jgi:hypothetical protein